MLPFCDNKFMAGKDLVKILQEILEDVRPQIWITLVFVTVFLVYRLTRSLKENLPPGPVGLPFLGYLPFLTKYPHLKFMQLAKKYGDVFSIYLASERVVVLNDAHSIREAFAKRELLARPSTSPLKLFGIRTPFFSSDFHIWQVQRRFVVQSMKDLGLGKSKIECLVQDEIQSFLNVLRESNAQPMNLEKSLTPSMSNNICSLVFGKRYKYTESSRIMLDHVLDKVPRGITQTSLMIFFPWLKNIPFLSKILKYDEIFEASAWLESFIDEKIRSHKETLDSTSLDFIHSYLLEIKARTEIDVKTSFTDEYLKGCIVNLVLGGSETVRSTISWSMYIMASFPDVQKKVWEEIQEVIGPNTNSQLSDQWKMPYTQAVIREIMRWKSVTPLSIFRYTLDDVEVAGYTLPKGSVVIANLWSVHHDSRYWKDPDTFRPERFLDENGCTIGDKHFMPFSVGKRSCPGESMAMMEIFLYFVSILQKFQVAFPPGFRPTFEVGLGMTYHLKPYQICFISR